MPEFNTRDLSRDLFHHLTHAKETQHKKEKKSSGVKMHFLSSCVLGVWVQIKKCVLLRMLLWLLSVLL